MDKKRRHNRFVVAGIAMAFVAAFAGPASAATDTQTVDATLAETLTFTIDDPDITGWVLNPTGANTISGGTATVSGNAVAFSMAVTSDVATLTEHNGAGYVTTGGEALAAGMVITAKQGLATIGATATDTPAVPLIPLNTPLGGTNVYDLTFSQATTLADAALVTGNTYHANLTYTVSTVL